MSTTPAAAPANAPESPLTLRSLVTDYGPIGLAGVGALLLVIALAPFIGGYPAGALYQHDVTLNALRALVGVAALCAPGSGARGRRSEENGPKARPGLPAVLPWLTAGLAALSLLVHSRLLTSPVLLYAMLPATLDWLSYALVFALAARLAAADRRLAVLLGGALAAVAAGAAVQTVRDYGAMAQQGLREYRAQAPFFDPNFDAGFLALLLPALTALCLAARERLAAFVVGVAASVAFGALVATGSRAGVAFGCVGLLTALILALATRPRDAAGLPWPRIGALLAAFAVMAFLFRAPLLSRGGAATGGDEHSGAFRTLTWKGTLAMAAAQPLLGAGPGTFGVLYPRYAIVERTDLAHDSYLQTAAEVGFPALLAAVAAIAAAWITGVLALLRRRRRRDAEPDDTTLRLLLCGLLGGLLAGALRSVIDSEWSLLGNGLPFWTAAGLVAGIGAAPKSAVAARPATAAAAGIRIAGALGLAVSLLLLQATETRDAVVAAARTGGAPQESVSAWPPDPSLLVATGHVDTAATVEPSGRRLYQLAAFQVQAQGDPGAAIRTLKAALAADPNSLQTWKRLAELEEQSGDHAGALAAWQELVRRYEGPVGHVRAIPELTETYPAFAYAALAEDAEAGHRTADADALYEKAAAIVEQYSQTSPEYQQVELASAGITGSDVLGKRQELRDLYTRVVDRLEKDEPARAAELSTRRDATLARLDKFPKPQNPGTPAQ